MIFPCDLKNSISLWPTSVLIDSFNSACIYSGNFFNVHARLVQYASISLGSFVTKSASKFRRFDRSSSSSNMVFRFRCDLEARLVLESESEIDDGGWLEFESDGGCRSTGRLLSVDITISTSEFEPSVSCESVSISTFVVVL